MATPPTGFLRHIDACNNACLPGQRRRLRVAGQAVGWMSPAVADFAGGTNVAADDLPAMGRRLAEAGLCQWRDEPFDVRARPGGVVLGTVDRGALPLLGIVAAGVHVNGLVWRANGLHVWVARRAADKKLDPGKLDHLVAGGIPAGLDAAETLVKEGEEEAGLPAALASSATLRSTIRYTMDRAEGLRRDILYCYDLALPDSFTPRPVDGEVAGFELWPVDRVIATVHDTDLFKFNVNLVLIDLFLRIGVIDDPALASALQAVPWS